MQPEQIVIILFVCAHWSVDVNNKAICMSYSNYYASSQLFHGSLSYIMGTQLDVLLVGGDRPMLAQVWNEVEAEVVRLDKMLNRFDPESEVSRLNDEARYYPVNVADELWNILKDCHRYYELTDNYFDITLQDFSKILFGEEDKSIFFLSESLSVDLGGFGKGYALQRIQEILQRNTLARALVNFGNSSVLAIGSHPQGPYWPVGIDNPYTHARIADLRLCDASMSTSGNMPSHPEHILDPHTGCYVTDRKMVSVLSADPLVAEILTTALMVAPETCIEAIANRFDIYEKHVYKL